jgi:hypothetical protein
MNTPHPRLWSAEIGAAIAARVVENRDGADEPPRNGILLLVKGTDACK